MTDELTEALDRALEALLDARVAAGEIGIKQVPDLALDAALSVNGPYKRAKADTRSAANTLRPLCSPEVWAAVLAHEAALRTECVTALDVAFSIGLTGSGRP